MAISDSKHVFLEQLGLIVWLLYSLQELKKKTYISLLNYRARLNRHGL